MSNFLVSLIRTWVPILVGTVIAWVVSTGLFDISDDQAAQATGAATAAAIGLYYSIVRWFETKYPQAGWLLGTPKPPEYVNPPAAKMAEE